MANTLTGLIPTIYAGLDIVQRELIGFLPNVTIDASASSGAVGQTVRSPVVPQASLEDITPGADPADSGDQTISYVDVSITKSRAYPIRWTGEEQLSVSRDGVGGNIMRDQFAQAFRTLANEMEADLAGLYTSASRAYGTAGTAPFGTAADLTDFANANRILDDNGCPQTGRRMIVGSAARVNLEGKQSVLFKVNESGTDEMLRRRMLPQLMGFGLGYSGQVASHTKGTGTSYQTAAAEPVGETSIAADTGSGTIVAGDVLTVAGDSNKYIVNTALGGGVVVLNKPGLKAAAADNAALAVGNSYTANLFFHESAMILAARPPAMPEGGDDADDVELITDPVSGLTFQVAIYRQYRRTKIEVALAWGVKCVKSEFLGVLLG